MSWEFWFAVIGAICTALIMYTSLRVELKEVQETTKHHAMSMDKVEIRLEDLSKKVDNLVEKYVDRRNNLNLSTH